MGKRNELVCCSRVTGPVEFRGPSWIFLRIALVGVLLVVAASRRYLPTPRRLATILVVAGAQTGHALAPPTQTAPPNSARHLGPTSLATVDFFTIDVRQLYSHERDVLILGCRAHQAVSS